MGIAFPDAPIFLQWTPQHTLAVRHDRLWQVRFDQLRVLISSRWGRSSLYARPRAMALCSSFLMAVYARTSMALSKNSAGPLTTLHQSQHLY